MKNPLTRRQLEVVKLLILGQTQLEAAKQLGITTAAVNHYVNAAKRTMNCATTFQLAFRLGLEAREALGGKETR